MDNETVNRILSIFEPYWKEQREILLNSKSRFVHCTSADSAIKIIQTKGIWMRNARCMNDYKEISHGYELLVNLFNDADIRKKFVDAIDSINTGIKAEDVFKNFDLWWKNIQSNTFICSISVHNDSEDNHGRLSMWRAYGQNSAKAAIVINAPFEPSNSANSLPLFLRPALYFTEDILRKELRRVISNINDNAVFLSTFKPEIISAYVFMWLLITTVCLKHDGFKEEKEWRIIYLPQMRSSEFMLSNIETVQGIPQLVYKIPLKKIPDKDIVGISIPQLLERIIIGPTDYPYPLSNAFIHELEKANIKDAASRVIVSGIPLRT